MLLHTVCEVLSTGALIVLAISEFAIAFRSHIRYLHDAACKGTSRSAITEKQHADAASKARSR